MAVATSQQRAAQLSLDDLPPALRRAAEACPFDLVPWIDPDCSVPPRPIEEDLSEYASKPEVPADATRLSRILARGDYFDASELLSPRIQYSVFLMRREGLEPATIARYLAPLKRFTRWLAEQGRTQGDALAGVDRNAWACGELPDIKRLAEEDWEWLALYEDPELAAYHNRQAILQYRPSGLDVSTETARRRSLDRIQDGVRRAMRVRDGGDRRRIGHGCAQALDELFWMWDARGRRTRWRRERWKRFPGKVRGSVAGLDLRLLRDLPVGHGGASTQRHRIRRVNLRKQPDVCPGGAACPRTRWYANFDGTIPEAAAAYKLLALAERKAICPQHFRPLSIATASQLVASCRSQKRKDWRNDRKEARSPRFGEMCHRLRTQGDRKRPWQAVADFVNRHPSLLEGLGQKTPVTKRAVEGAALDHRLVTDPEFARRSLERTKARKTAAFDRWIEKRFQALRSEATVGRELLAMSQDEQRTLFGGFSIGFVAGQRGQPAAEVRKARQRLRRKRQLERLIESMETQPNDDDGGNGERQHGEPPAEAAEASTEAEAAGPGQAEAAHPENGDGDRWSEPHSPSEWARVFAVTPKTFVRWVREGTVRARRLTSKSYRVHIEDVPEVDTSGHSSPS